MEIKEDEYKKMIDEVVKNLNGGFVDFEGHNCEGPCAGWDGKSRRCECGNRRVLWQLGWDNSFVYAEAF